MELDKETVWSTNVIETAHDFAEAVQRMCNENPSKLADPLTNIMNDTMTELWDRGFSQTEIRQAFHCAIGDLDRYAGGKERRS